MKNIALTNLNETELEVFNKKIDAIKTFVDAFGQNTISFRTVCNKFTVKEMMCKEMNAVALDIGAPVNMIARIEYVTYNIPRYINEARQAGFVTEETMTALFDEILASSVKSLEYVQEHVFWGLYGKGKDVFNKIIENKKTHLFETKSIINMIDNTIANEDFDDAFVDRVLEAFPNYNGFILTLTNPNVPYAKKYATLKKSFRQKHFNEYVSQLSKNLTDLNDLDTFIDVTIVNNNRIKEKNKNIWNVFRRIFVGTKLTSVRYNCALKNKKDFFDKYSKYITPSVLAELVKDMYSDYNINDNMSLLIRDMYSNLSLNDKLDLCISNDYVFRSLIAGNTSLKDMFIDNDDVTIRNKIIKLNASRNGNSGLTSLINIFTKNIIDYLNTNYDENIIGKELIGLPLNEVPTSALYFSLLSDELFEKVDLYRPGVTNKLFIISDATQYRAVEVTNNMLAFIGNLMKIASPKKKEIIYNKIFAFLENEDSVSDLLEFASDIISDKNSNVKYNYSRSYWNSGTDINKMIKTNADWFRNILTTYYPDKVDAMSNLDNFIISYELLANI